MIDIAAAVEVRHLRKRYKSTVAVDGVSLDVETGTTLGILGANGAGKSTTVEMIAGLRRPDEGSICILGLDPVTDRRAVRQLLGVQLQSSHLHGSLTVRELLGLYRSFYPNPRPADELLELVQLTDKAGTRFGDLSGGQQQRLSVALALVGRPKVVILDEMSTGLDPRARRRLWSTIEQLKEQETTIMLVSHAMDEVEHLCDRIVLLDQGRIMTQGTPASVMAGAQASSLDEAFVTLTGHELEVAE